MRVMLVAHRYPPDSFAGVEVYTHRLADELTRAGETVSVVARKWTGAAEAPQPVRLTQPNGSTLYRFDGGDVQIERFLDDHERLEHLFTGALVEAAPDVVHFNHLLGLSPRFLEIAHRLRSAIVISLHDLYFSCPLGHLQKNSGDLCNGPDGGRECARTCFATQDGNPSLRWGLRNLYYRRLLRLAQRLVAGSRFVASYFERYVPELSPVRVIPNGVPDDEIQPVTPAFASPTERGCLNLAFWGTIVPHKGPHIILDALQGAELGPVNLVLLGQVLPYEEIRNYVRQLRAQAAAIPGVELRVYGTFRREELPFLLSDVDCVVLPSLVPEAGPQVPREALARGLPVLVSRLGALPETIIEGETGFTFHPHAPVELKAILKRLVCDETLLGLLRENVRRSHKVTVAEHAGALRTIYAQARDDLAARKFDRGADVAELGFLHEALVQNGFPAHA